MDREKDRKGAPAGDVDLQAFAWTYAQETGELQQDGKHVATGYSGAGHGKNNPDMQEVHNLGPIPQGDWTIVGPPVNTADHGPYVLTLKPAADTPTFGRSGFLMHGDSKESPVAWMRHPAPIRTRAGLEERRPRFGRGRRDPNSGSGTGRE